MATQLDRPIATPVVPAPVWRGLRIRRESLAPFITAVVRQITTRPWLLAVLTIAVVLVAWETSPKWGLIDKHLMPAASVVFAEFLKQWLDPGFYHDMAVTLMRVVGGLLIGAAIAIPAGLAMGYWGVLHRMFSLTVDVVRPIPSSAFVPAAAVIFGIGHEMHLFVVFLATSVPILLSTIDGVRAVDPVLIGTAKTLGRSSGQMFRTVLLPAALPYIVTGLRISIAIALIVGISSEMILSTEGLGRRVVYAQRTLRIPELFAGVLTLAMLGYLLNRGFVAIERRVLRWHYQSKAKGWD